MKRNKAKTKSCNLQESGVAIVHNNELYENYAGNYWQICRIILNYNQSTKTYENHENRFEIIRRTDFMKFRSKMRRVSVMAGKKESS